MVSIVWTSRSALIPRLDTEVLLQLCSITTYYHLALFQTVVLLTILSKLLLSCEHSPLSNAAFTTPARYTFLQEPLLIIITRQNDDLYITFFHRRDCYIRRAYSILNNLDWFFLMPLVTITSTSTGSQSNPKKLYIYIIEMISLNLTHVVGWLFFLSQIPWFITTFSNRTFPQSVVKWVCFNSWELCKDFMQNTDE